MGTFERRLEAVEAQLGAAPLALGDLVPLRDDTGAVAAALRGWSDHELEAELALLDRDIPRRLELYSLLAARAVLAEPDLPWPRNYRAMELRLTYRNVRPAGIESDGCRHQWSLILDCPLHELDGGAAVKETRPPFRILPADYELTQEDQERGLELLLRLRPRWRRPIWMFGGNDLWRWPASSDELTLSLIAELANPQNRARLVGDDPAFWSELLEAAERRARLT